MKFLITFHHVDGAWDALSAEQQAQHGAWLKDFVAELKAEKNAELVFLHPYAEARTVRMDEAGEIQVSEGPDRDGPEQLGGYYVIEAGSLEEAVEWARKGRFMLGSNEVRQIY